MLNFFKKKEKPEIKPSVQSKGLDETQLYKAKVESKEIPNNGRKNIILMDDVHFMNESLQREIKRIPDLLSRKDMVERVFKNIKERFGNSCIKEIEKWASRFDISDYNFILFDTDKCGYQVIQSCKDSNSKVDFAILDIILGGVVIDDEESFVIIDGMDVGKSLIEMYPDIRIMFHTGCSMNNSKEEVKYKALIGDNPNVNVTIKGLDHIERYADMFIMLSGVSCVPK